MAYSQMIPTVLASLERRRQERTQPSWATTAGENLLQAPMPEFENPWVQLAASFGKGLIGGGFQSYGRDQDIAAQDAYDAQASQAMSQAMQMKDLNERAGFLQSQGLGEVAQTLNVAQMMTEAERAEKLLDPEFKLKEREFAFNQEMERGKLGIEEDKANTSRILANAQMRQIKLAESANQNKPLLDAISETNKAIKEGTKDQQQLLNTMLTQDKNFQVYNDYNRRTEEVEGLIDIAMEAQAKGDVAGFNRSMQKVLESFIKKPNETIMSDDTVQYLQQGTYWDTFQRLKGRITGQGGSFIPDIETAQSLKKIIVGMRQEIEDALAPTVEQYIEMGDVVGQVPSMLGVDAEAIKNLQAAGYILPQENLIRKGFGKFARQPRTVRDPKTGEEKMLMLLPRQAQAFDTKAAEKARKKKEAEGWEDIKQQAGAGIANALAQASKFIR